jgi:hypothetical protein
VQLHGIDARQRVIDVQCMYSGCPAARRLLGTYRVRYIVVGPQERAMMPINTAFLRMFPLAASSGGYELRAVATAASDLQAATRPIP